MPWFVLLYVANAADSAYVKLLSLGADCTGDERREVNDVNTYKIVWNSEDIPDGCRFKFSATGAVIRDDYKVCVEPTHYDFKDCNVQLSYYLGFNAYPEHTLSCRDKPLNIKICGRIGEYFDIAITKKNSHLSYTNTNSRFTLKVTAVQLYDHSDRQGVVGGIIGGVIGGIALLVIIGVIIIIYTRRVRRSPQHNYTGGRGFTNRSLDRTTENKTNKLDPKLDTSKPQSRNNNTNENYGYTRDKSELTYDAVQLEPGEVMI